MKCLPLIGLMILFFPCCANNEKEHASDIKSFVVQGEVVALDKDARTISISHREIPGLMKPMTMPFKMKNPALLETIFIGDSVSGVLFVSKNDTYLDTVNVYWKNTALKKE